MIDQKSVTQNEPTQGLGSRGVVSEILSGKREMNLRQMSALAIRFCVPATALVGGAGVAVRMT